MTVFTKVIQRESDLLAALDRRGARRILIAGPPGTGKTTLAATLKLLFGIRTVRHTDDLLSTHSLTSPVGPPTDRERAAIEDGWCVPAVAECALLTEVCRWLREPAPWIIEGSFALPAWTSAVYRSGVPAGVDAGILCGSPLRPPLNDWHWVASREDILRLWVTYEPDVVFADGLMVEWAPPPAAAALAALARRLRAGNAEAGA